MFDGESDWKIDAIEGNAIKTMLTAKEAFVMMNETNVQLEN